MSTVREILIAQNIDPAKGEKFLEVFSSLQDTLVKCAEGAASIQITQEGEVEKMAQAKALAKEVASCRIAVEKARKALKEESLKEGRAVDAVAAAISEPIAALETRLKALANYDADRAAERAKAAEEAFQAEQRRKADEERVAQAAYEKAEREAKDREIEALKKEAEEKEKALAEERAKAEAERKAVEEKARKEKEAQEKALAEERAKAEAERLAIERKHAEELARLAAMVTCPKCGHEFDPAKKDGEA